MTEKRPTDYKRAFISHSTVDDGYVAELKSLVLAMGYSEVFNDVDSIKPDEQFWPVIAQGITAADTLIVVITATSINSTWVNREVELARGLNKKIVPIWIEDCKCPATFADRDVIDFRPRNRVKDRKIVPSRILRHSPQRLFGRDKWLDELDAAWANHRLNLYTLVAWGGVGKTSVVAHWVAQRLMGRGWPGVERYFDWSFYSQGTGESRQTSADLFINQALQFFDDSDPTLGSAWDRGERLAKLIRQHRTLLVLDGIEPLQYPPNDKSGLAGRLKDPGLESLIQSLAADNPGLCIITTRKHLANVEVLATAAEMKLDQLPKEAAIALLQHLQIVGSDEELQAACKDAGGHALTLQLLGRFIADAYPDRDIRHSKEVKFAELDQERQGRSAFKVMIAYDRWLTSAGPERQRELALLRLTGLFDRPISRDCLQALCAEPAIPGLTEALVNLKETQWNIALKRLGEIDLLTDEQDAIDAHPLIREYFAKQLCDTQPVAFKKAHSRLFDYFCKLTPDRPDTLDGLQPLYQAIVHGCLAGRQDEACKDVYHDRILRGLGEDGFYSTKKLGAISADLAAVSSFFDEPWCRVSQKVNEADHGWLLNETGFYLRALGRLMDALVPIRAGLNVLIAQEDWKNAARSASNLCQLEVTLGRLSDAVVNSRQSIVHADRSGDPFHRLSKRTVAADALHQSGQRVEAGTLFVEAERIQKERQPQFDLLCSLSGFRYCDWLLAPAERTAWQVLVSGTGVSSVAEPHSQDEQARICEEVQRRTTTIFEWRRDPKWNSKADSELDNALDYLTLARVGVIRGILGQPPPQPVLDVLHVDDSVSRLRSTRAMDKLPKGVLTAALYHFVRGQHELAGADLDEAQQIAERGPMPLYLADVHLHRARLFRDKAELTKARALIEKHGYWRRKEELEDAEAAI